MLQTILVFSPFLGAIVAGLFGRLIGDRAAQLVTCGLMGVTALCAWINLFANLGEPAFKVHLLEWIVVGSFDASWALRVDSLSTVMMLVVGLHQLPDPRLRRGLHVPRPQHPALHELPVAVHLRDADAGDVRQPAPAVLRLGGRGRRLLPADRLLVRPSLRPAPRRSRRSSSTASAISAWCWAWPPAFLVFDSIQYDVIFANVPEVRRAPRCTRSAAISARST